MFVITSHRKVSFLSLFLLVFNFADVKTKISSSVLYLTRPMNKLILVKCACVCVCSVVSDS